MVSNYRGLVKVAISEKGRKNAFPNPESWKAPKTEKSEKTENPGENRWQMNGLLKTVSISEMRSAL